MGRLGLGKFEKLFLHLATSIDSKQVTVKMGMAIWDLLKNTPVMQSHSALVSESSNISWCVYNKQ